MATNILDAFVVTFGLDNAQFKSKAAEVDDISKKTGDRAKKAFGEIEDQGKALGQAFRTVRNEAIGLFLAFTGASSLTNFITGMLTGAATADRFGQTVGMATGRVVAWRQAMKEIGGNAGSADAGLGIIEKAAQDIRLTGKSPIQNDLLGLGVSRADLQNKDPGRVLEQLAQARGRMSGPEFNARLQRIGMPQDMIYFLAQGADNVRKLISTYEKNAKQYEKEAKAAEDLQKSMAQLEATIANKLVPPVTKIAEFLNRAIGDLGKPPAPKSQRTFVWGQKPGGSHWWDGVFTIESYGGAPPGASPPRPAAPSAPSSTLASTGGAVYKAMIKAGVKPDVAMGIAAGVMAEGGTPNAVNPSSGAFGIGQWLNSRKSKLIQRYGPHPTQSQQIQFLIWELFGGDPAHGGASVLAANSSEAALDAYIRAFMRPKSGYETTSDIWRGRAHLAYLRTHQPQTVNIGHITVHTKATDAHGVARGLHHALHKRGIVTQADGGVAP